MARVLLPLVVSLGLAVDFLLLWRRSRGWRRMRPSDLGWLAFFVSPMIVMFAPAVLKIVWVIAFGVALIHYLTEVRPALTGGDRGIRCGFSIPMGGARVRTWWPFGKAYVGSFGVQVEGRTPFRLSLAAPAIVAAAQLESAERFMTVLGGGLRLNARIGGAWYLWTSGSKPVLDQLRAQGVDVPTGVRRLRLSDLN